MHILVDIFISYIVVGKVLRIRGNMPKSVSSLAICLWCDGSVCTAGVSAGMKAKSVNLELC